jgi:hypothetical protein
MTWFDGSVTGWPKLSVMAGLTADPGPDTIVIGSGPPIGTGRLGGITMVELADSGDIGDGIRSIIRTGWGRDSELDTAGAQQCEIVIGNQSGQLDPLNPATPWWGPNLLSTNQSSLETDTTGWLAGQDTTIARSTAQAFVGSASLALTKTVGTGILYAQTPGGTGGVRFPPNTALRAAVRFRAFSTGRPCTIRVAFHDLTGTYIPGADLISAPTTDSSGGWTAPVVVTGLSPDQETYIAIELRAASNGAGVVGEVHYADDVKLQATSLDIGLPIEVYAEKPLGTRYRQFTGKVTRLTLDAGLDPTITLQCADAMEEYGRVILAKEIPQFDGDSTGERIGRLLDRAAVPATARSLDAGHSRLGLTTLGGPLLELIRRVEQTEFGFYFVDAEGRRVFYDRHRASTANRSVIVQLRLTDTAGAGEVGMADLQLDRDTDRTWNDWHITREQHLDPDIGEPDETDTPVEQVGSHTLSLAKYGTLSGPAEVGALHPSDTQTSAMAQYLADRFGWPRTRIRSVTINALHPRVTDESLWPTLLKLQPLDLLSVRRDYGANTITAQLHIQKLEVEIRADPPTWQYTLTTTNPPPKPNLFLLGESVIGTGRLGW